MFQIRRNDNKNHTIIEETRAKKERHFIKSERIQKLIPVLNRYSLLFHVLLACGVCFAIEWISRHSFLSACSFVIDRNLVFLYNSLIVFASLMLVYTVKRRALLRTVISVLWLFLGTINGCILAKRVSPFSFTDIKMVGDLFTMQSNYFPQVRQRWSLSVLQRWLHFSYSFGSKDRSFREGPIVCLGFWRLSL